MAKLYFGINDFQVVRTIGVGAYSRLKLVQHAGSQRYYVAKAMAKVELVRLKQVHNVKREKDILCAFVNRSEFILQIEGHFSDDRFLYIITEFCSGGDLAQWIQTRPERRCTEEQARFYAAQVVMAVEHLHVRGIAHRDIKPDNIALMKDGYIKLIDFGFAKYLGADRNVRTFTGLGTPEYLSPECIQGVGHGIPLDLWLIGILLYEMLCGKVGGHKMNATQAIVLPPPKPNQPCTLSVSSPSLSIYLPLSLSLGTFLRGGSFRDIQTYIRTGL